MKNRDFQNLVNQSLSGLVMDERLRRNVRQAMRDEDKKLKKTLPALRIAALAAALILATTAVAVAAGSGLLDYLFHGRSKPSARQQALVQGVNARHEADGVSVAVTEALLSGDRLSMAFGMEAERPVWVHLLGVTVNGQDAPGMNTNVLNQFIGDPFASGHQEKSGGLTCLLENGVEGSAQIKVHLALLVPNGEMVHMPNADAGNEEAVRALIQQGKVVTTGDYGEYGLAYDQKAAASNAQQNALTERLSALDALERDLTDAEKAEQADLQAKMDTIADLYIHYGNMALLDDFTLKFDISADAERPVTFHLAAEDGTPAHYQAVIEQARLDAMGFTLRARLYAVQGGWTREEIERRSSTFQFYDEQHEPLLFQDTWMERDAGGYQQDENGTRYTEVVYRMPALERMPTRIYAVPTDAEPLWEDAIPLCPDDAESDNG